MKPEELYQAMELPERCRLGKRVFKKLFHENATLTPADKRALSSDVSSISWQYTLKPSTLPVAAYQDEEREYIEIAVLEVGLERRKNAPRLAEVVHRAIPYPVILVLADEDGASVSTAHKRFSRAEHGAVVADGVLHTPWLDGGARSELERTFLRSLSVGTLPQANFLALYGALVDRVLAFICSAVSGQFRVVAALDAEERREQLARCRELERTIAELRAAIRAENSFARQVELNTLIKQHEQQLAESSAAL